MNDDVTGAASGRIELPIEAEEFLVWLTSERGRSRNTVQAYRRDLLAYERWLRARGSGILSVSTTDLVDLVAERRGSGAATTSIARQIAAIRMLHRYLAVEQYRPDDPTARLDGVKVPSGIPKPLTEEQVGRLADALSSKLGRTVTVRNVVDESVVGGVVTQIGDEVIDGTIRTRLNQLREAF